MRRFVYFVLFLFSLSYGDTVILTDGKYSTYVQEEEFMLAEGENVLGPVSVLPTAVVQAIEVYTNNVTVKSIIFEKTSQNWKKNLLGKYITVEGEGRIIRGTVISIDEKYITLNTKKGFVVTTVPQFPSRISSHLRWDELFSPQITLMVNSSEAQSQVFKLRYPITGLSWKVSYTLDIRDGVKVLKGYILIENSSSVDFKGIDLKINGKVKKYFEKVSIPPYTVKRVLFFNKKAKNINLKNLPDGDLFVYKMGVFVKKTKLKNISDL